MGMQYDVKQGHLNNSGFVVLGRNRLKAASTVGSANAGTLDIFDTTTAPVSATYSRTAAVITVTKVAHGLNTGDVVGITFATASGLSGTNGNYSITRTGADTFTVTDVNSGNIAGGTVAAYASRWVASFDIGATDVFSNFALIPGEGILVQNGIYLSMSNITSANVYYG
jgi:hypothetical protein